MDDLSDQYTQYENNTNPLDFFTSSGEFNTELFNRTFREEQLKRIKFYRNQEQDFLNSLDTDPPEKKLLDFTVGEHVINTKDAFFGIIYDLSSEQLTSDIFTKNNRLFYLGLIFLTIYLTYLFLKNLND